jgi:hypothetical protein
MFASLRRACSRALGGAVLAALLVSACGGGDSTNPSSSSSKVTVAGADGASVTFDERNVAAKSGRTVRVARNASGAPQLPSNVVPVGGIYEFTPLGLIAPGVEIRVPFNADALPGGTRPQLLVAAPGEPWMQVRAARVEGAAMVARVHRLTHAVVVAVPEVRSGGLFKQAFGSGDDYSPLVQVAVASSSPALPVPDAEGVVPVTQPTTMTLRATYELPAQCTERRHITVAVHGIELDANGEQVGESASVLAEFLATSPSGELSVPYEFAAGRRGVYFTMIRAVCINGIEFTFAGMNGFVFQVDTTASPAPAPVISVAPQDRSVIEGDTATFAVEAKGANLAYQWQRSNDGGQTYSPVAGAGASLSVVASLADHGSLWRVLVSYEGGTTTSTPGVLSVAQRVVAPVVTSDPSNQTVVEGETASFTAVGTGTPAPAIEWQVRSAAAADPEAGWSVVAGATASTYTTAATTLSQSGAQYRAVLRNAGGTAASLPATMSVQQRVIAPAITSAPQPLTAQAGQFGTFAVTATGTAPLSYQWFRNGQAIAGANASELLVLADPVDAGSSYQISVQVSNPAGTVQSSAAAMTIVARPVVGTPVSVTAAEGGGIELSEDTALSFPPGAVLSDATVTVRSMDPSEAQLPDGLIATSNGIEIGPAGTTFLQPVTLSVPSPASVSADKVWALVELPLTTSETQAKLMKGGQNLRRTALGMNSAGNRVLAATSAPLNVYCATSQSSLGGRQLVHLHRAARYFSTEVAQEACTAGATMPKPVVVPSTTAAPCERDEFVSDSLGDQVLKSRHVHCATNSTDLGWLQDERGNHGYFRLAWRVGSDGDASALKKNYRLKFQLVRTQVADVNPVNAPLTLDIAATVACASQQFVGSCSGNKGSTKVTSGQGWSQEVFLPIGFAWEGPVSSWNEFVFGQIVLDYKMATQVDPSTLWIAGPPTLRCDKGLAKSGSDGCVYAQAPAVFVLSSTDALVAEAAQHIKEAQGNPINAPGRLEFAGGAANVSGSLALQRSTLNNVRRANRSASCEAATSIIETRLVDDHKNRSPYCATSGAVCDCDEYPFAATWSGAFFDADRTSAKMVRMSHNRSAGSRFGKFLEAERIIDFSQYDGALNEAFDPLLLRSRSGDNFWIHIE